MLFQTVNDCLWFILKTVVTRYKQFSIAHHIYIWVQTNNSIKKPTQKHLAIYRLFFLTQLPLLMLT